MSRQHYEQLIRQFCTLCEVEGAQGILDGGPVAVNGVAFSLHHDEQVDARALLVYCDFGEIEKGSEAEAYRALLETNLLMYSLNGPMYAVSPLTGRVVFANHYPVESIDAKDLRNILAHLAAMARDWRKSQFLAKPPRGNSKPVNTMQRQWAAVINTNADGKDQAS